jgi:predicted DsbA family dithiol-disulfide isomerase
MTDPYVPEPVPIAVISDVMCPWCFIGMRRLEQALDQLPELSVAVNWWPFLLDPTIPPEGVSRSDYLRQKFGSPDGGEMYRRVREAGDAEGIAFNFEAIETSPNTINAHRLIHWASAFGRQSAIVERLFQLYFEEGADVGDADVLAEAAGGVGLSADAVRAKLATDDDRAAIVEMIRQTQAAGVSAVPTFIIGGKRGVIGAQPVALLVEQISLAAEEFAASRSQHD